MLELHAIDTPAPQPDIAALARVHGPACIGRLVQILDGPDASASVEAARELLNRGYGVPTLPIAFDVAGVTVEISTAPESDAVLRRTNGADAGARDAC
jgi:hypothetical protein